MSAQLAAATTKAPSERRRAVVDAAARLFSERGYHGTSIQHLADALGLQKGSIYTHIGSKEDLLLDVVNDGADRFLERGEQALAMEAPATVRLRRLLVSHIETAIEHLDAATVFLNEWRYLSEPNRAAIKGKRDRYEAIVRQIIQEGIDAGEFRGDANVRFAARLVLSAGNWTYAWFRPGGELGPTQIGERFADLLIRGLAT